MSRLLQKTPFLVELFFNGTFILLYSLKSMQKLPPFLEGELVKILLDVGTSFVPLILLLSVIVNYINSKGFEDFLRKYIFSLVVFIPMIITYGDTEFTFWLASAHLLSSVLSLYDDPEPTQFQKKQSGSFLVQNFTIRPAQIVLLSFSGMIFLGTLLLMIPFSSKSGSSLPFVDALFMATSATCVTGLATISVGNTLSLFGQIVLLFLIQIGGLSIMTLYSSTVVLLGRVMGMKERIVMQDLLEITSLEELMAIIMDIIKYTLFIELWGAIILTIAFTIEGQELTFAIYNGFFHSISAFCNAGLSLYDNSFESFSTNPLIHGTVMILITLGGLGFLVLKELRDIVLRKRSLENLSLHSKIVLATSFLLTFGGAIFIFFNEFLNSLDAYSLWEKIQISLFQSVTARTAGFDTIPISNFSNSTIYFMTLLMFVGASPGSTGGGIKTTTLAILIQSIRATLTGQKNVTVLDRKIPYQMVVKATAITFISIMITCVFVFVLMKLETGQSFLALFFEVVSAGATVGLSLGVTPFLSVIGKFAITLMMFVGRIGPLTLVLAIGEKSNQSGKVSYPDGRIMLG